MNFGCHPCILVLTELPLVVILLTEQARTIDKMSAEISRGASVNSVLERTPNTVVLSSVRASRLAP